LGSFGASLGSDSRHFGIAFKVLDPNTEVGQAMFENVTLNDTRGITHPYHRRKSLGTCMNVPAGSTASARMLTRPGDTVIIDSPRAHDETALVAIPSSVETWIVHTPACEQKLGVDPWFSMTIGRLDESEGPLHGSDPEALLARLAGRPSVFFFGSTLKRV
jgi:hypothetical protein